MINSNYFHFNSYIPIISSILNVTNNIRMRISNIFINLVSLKNFQSNHNYSINLIEREIILSSKPAILFLNQSEENYLKVIEYSSGQGKHLIPCGEFIGQGESGKVFLHATDDLAVIKIPLEARNSLRKEFEVGLLVNEHPCFTQTKSLFIKKDHKTDSVLKEKLVLEKKLPIHSPSKGWLIELSKEDLIRNLNSFKDAVCFLYDKKIAWRDIHSDNLLRDENNNIALCDYGGWKIEENSIYVFQPLLIESWYLVKNLVDASVIKGQVAATDDESRVNWTHNSRPLFKATDEERKAYIVSFFNEVIDQINQQI